MLKPLLVTSLVVAFNSGCATPASAEAMSVLPHQLIRAPAPQMQGAVTLGEVSGGSPTSLLWVSQVGDPELKEALRDSLAGAGLIAAGPGRYTLKVVLLSLQQPMSGFDVTVTASLWCSLTDSGSGAVVWQEAVAASHTATLGDAFVIFERVRLASEGSLHQTLRKVVDRVGEGVPLASVNLM